MVQTKPSFARDFVPIALILFAVMPVLYGNCPQEMCCPVGANCEANTDLCKPESSDDCQKGNVLIFSSHTVITARVAS